jgi:hypothetical protein
MVNPEVIILQSIKSVVTVGFIVLSGIVLAQTRQVLHDGFNSIIGANLVLVALTCHAFVVFLCLVSFIGYWVFYHVVHFRMNCSLGLDP